MIVQVCVRVRLVSVCLCVLLCCECVSVCEGRMSRSVEAARVAVVFASLSGERFLLLDEGRVTSAFELRQVCSTNQFPPRLSYHRHTHSAYTTHPHSSNPSHSNHSTSFGPFFTSNNSSLTSGSTFHPNASPHHFAFIASNNCQHLI